MSTLKVNAIKRYTGTTITLGESGDTITIATGAAMGGSGASLTALNATQLTSGTIPDARFGTLPAVSGANLTSLNASNFGSGTFPEAYLPASALGSVWESKSADFDAAIRTNYFVDTSGNTVTGTLPGSATAGDEIHFLDSTGSFDTNTFTVGRNLNKIQGETSDLTVTLDRAGFTLVYCNAAQGWLLKDK